MILFLLGILKKVKKKLPHTFFANFMDAYKRNIKSKTLFQNLSKIEYLS